MFPSKMAFEHNGEKFSLEKNEYYRYTLRDSNGNTMGSYTDSKIANTFADMWNRIYTYPPKFSIVHKCTKNTYVFTQVGNEDKWECSKDGLSWGAFYSEEEIEENLQDVFGWDNLKELPTESVVKEGIKLPKKFEFKYFGDIYQTSLQSNGHTYDCTDEFGITFDMKIEHCQQYFDQGTYTITKTFDEPELVFPFTFKNTAGDTIFTAKKTEMGSVHVLWPNSYYGSYYTVEEVMRRIKEGEWLVQSVGEAVGDVVQPVQALAIKVDSKDALAAVKELTEALNELYGAGQRVTEMTKGFKNV